MTDQVGEIQQSLLEEARRQTKALEGIYALAIVFAVLAGAGLLFLLVGALT